MKKYIAVFLVVICVVFLLTWCHYIDKYELARPKDEIKSVEIVQVDKNIFILKGYFKEISLIAEIPEDRWGVFWDAFNKISCHKGTGPEGAYIEGYAIRITYTDGGFELIGERGGYYSADGVEGEYIAYHFDEIAFRRFVEEEIARSKAE